MIKQLPRILILIIVAVVLSFWLTPEKTAAPVVTPENPEITAKLKNMTYSSTVVYGTETQKRSMTLLDGEVGMREVNTLTQEQYSFAMYAQGEIDGNATTTEAAVMILRTIGATYAEPLLHAVTNIEVKPRQIGFANMAKNKDLSDFERSAIAPQSLKIENNTVLVTIKVPSADQQKLPRAEWKYNIEKVLKYKLEGKSLIEV